MERLGIQLDSWPAELVVERRQVAGVEELLLTLAPGATAPAGPLGLTWRFPATGIAGMWHPGLYRDRSLRADWSAGIPSHATVNAPVICLFGADGGNRLTFACSEALRPVELFAGIVEETGEMRCEVRLLATAESLAGEPVCIRVDTRPIAFQQALAEVSDWWATMPLHTPSPVPEAARRPMYSTWYSFHQALTADAVLHQCALAHEMGCSAVIVDDGWQCEDAGKGYSYCGDWEPAGSKLGDWHAFTGRVHELGMQALLWLALPWVGPNSKAWQRFQHMTLRHVPQMQASVLDPRYPEVRQHLIDTAVRPVSEGDFDGLKLDFVDRWHDDGQAPARTAGMDYASIYDAADRLLSDLMAALRAIKPGIMIEFRQRYIGPLMRKYGNLFRAGDCPADAITNRVRTIDVRLLAGHTATHSDMLMWHPQEPVESAARQLLNVLFSVPQISVRIDALPEPHRRMLGFWLAFWNRHRDVLLDGELEPQGPEQLYPVISATLGDTRITALYGEAVVRLPADLPEKCLLINASAGDRVILDFAADAGRRRLRICDTEGREIHTGEIACPAGPQAVAIPPSGLAALTAVAGR